MIVFNEIFPAFSESEQITVYLDGNSKSYLSDCPEYKEIVLRWNDMTEGARQMPAFGVSLDSQTKEGMKSGLWIEFVFSEDCECYNMSFEKLLVEVREGYSGFNVIRYNALYGYDGRCYYIDLNNKNMANLNDYLRNL